MEMAAVLSKAFIYVGIILLGLILRRVGFFKEEDFSVLSKIVLKITLPAAIISSFSNKEIDVSMLSLCLIGFLGGVLYIALAYIMNIHKTPTQRAFAVMNQPAYNIGNFTLPFVQGFLGSTGVIVTALFDAGNSFIALGLAYFVAGQVLGTDGKFSFSDLFTKLSRSVALDVYVVMTILALFHIHLPEFVTSFATTIGNGNAFLAMLMIGVGFHLTGDREQFVTIAKIIITRYAVAIALALCFYFLLPFSLEVRQTLAVLVFAPIGSAAPAYTSELGLDVGLSTAINSISILISIVSIVTVLLIIL